MNDTEQCSHAHTRLRKRAGVPTAQVQRQCLACRRGVGPSTNLDHFSKSQQRVLEPWADGGQQLDFGPEAA
jgi:hypothetical protein